MSTMLEQAIVDASALREAAIQNAEQAVVSKFSNQIKQTVETLLEQDEPGSPSIKEDPTPKAAVPETYGKDENAPEDADEKSIVEEQLDDIEGKAYAFGDSSNKTQFALDDGELIEIDLEQIVAEGVVDVDEQQLEELTEEKEMVEIDDGELMQLEEKVTFEHEEERTGWMSGPDQDIINAKIVHAVRKEIEEMTRDELDKKEKTARRILTKLKRENKTILLKNKKLVNEQKNLIEHNQNLLEGISQLKEKFDEVQLMNVKLLYTNKVLTDTTLNRRQKNEIVESISKVDEIETAKIVYETLQSAVRTSLPRKPESLSEAVGRHASTSILLKAHKKGPKEENSNLLADRMKRLAGI
mgnify:CR=1 FL=1